MKSIFPDPNLASEEGLLTVGGFITPEILLMHTPTEFFHGLSQWTSPSTWFSPDPRGVIDLNFTPSKISPNPSSNVISNLSSIEILSKSLRSVQNITHETFQKKLG